MEAHHFEEDIKVQRFCLTLLGEARLWYQSLETLEDTTLAQLQNYFRQRYSKLGNTCKQLFHVWRPFTYDENMETIDSYVIRIRLVVTLLGYGEPQNFRSVQEHIANKVILDPISYRKPQTSSRHCKKILTKDKLDKQLTGQTPLVPS